MNKLITILTNEIKLFFKIQKSEREWYIPFLASFCTAVPLFLGLYFNKITYGSLACMSAFIILRPLHKLIFYKSVNILYFFIKKL